MGCCRELPEEAAQALPAGGGGPYARPPPAARNGALRRATPRRAQTFNALAAVCGQGPRRRSAGRCWPADTSLTSSARPDERPAPEVWRTSRPSSGSVGAPAHGDHVPVVLESEV